MSDSVLVETKGAVRWIVLNRPEVLNTFDDEMGGALLEALDGASDSSIRAVVLAGAGRAFCAGEDLGPLAGLYKEGKAPDHGEILRSRYNPVIERMIGLRKPVVAAINGVAAGAGMALALACDFRVMAAEARLVPAFSKVGLVPDSGSTWLLSKYLGVGRALDVAIRSDPIEAERALALGLVNVICPAEEVPAKTEELSSRLAWGPTFAFGLIKSLVWSADSATLSEQLEKEAGAQSVAGQTKDHIEGVDAFMNKRDARFEGR